MFFIKKRFYIYLKKPYQITNDFDIHLFRSGLKPMWEVNNNYKFFKKLIIMCILEFSKRWMFY